MTARACGCRAQPFVIIAASSQRVLEPIRPDSAVLLDELVALRYFVGITGALVFAEQVNAANSTCYLIANGEQFVQTDQIVVCFVRFAINHLLSWRAGFAGGDDD